MIEEKTQIDIIKGDNSQILKEDLLKLKKRLLGIEEQLQTQIKDLEEREEKWKILDAEVDDIKDKSRIVNINVSGKKFATTIETLLSLKDTIFYKLILSKKFDISQELFFDRSSRMFSVILDFLRYKKISYERFSQDELYDLLVEADYYEISEISEHLSKYAHQLEFVAFEYNGPYIYSGASVGNNDVKELSERNLSTGIVANSPGWIIIEFNFEAVFDEVEVGGYNGNTTAFSPSNGANCPIYTSKDKVTWTYVGTLPSNHGNSIQLIKLTQSSAKYIKFQHTGYLGIGFVGIKQA